MTSLRLALAVPPANHQGFDRKVLERWRGNKGLDLVVFPEAWRSTRADEFSLASAREASVAAVREVAEDLGLPVLAGVWCEFAEGGGIQCAAYVNPSPEKGETAEHFYAKHSTSEVLPYELPDYAEEREALFAPIALRGRKLGVQLCHDQFFGLVSEKLTRAGADVLLDLTGTSVVRSKWTNVITGRTLERPAPFFCTMSERATKTTNEAFALGMRDGRAIAPLETAKSAKHGQLVLYAVDGPLAPFALRQAFSPKPYDAFTIRFTRGAADLVVLPKEVPPSKGAAWKELRVGTTKVGVLELPLEALLDPLAIHRHEALESPFGAHIVCFVAGDRPALPRPKDELIALARLRAIEHRVAVVIATPDVQEVLKSSRYKNIQRFPVTDGKVGMELDFVEGTYASMGKTAGQGIAADYQETYKGLLDPITGSPRKQATKKRESVGTAEALLGKIAFSLGEMVGRVVRGQN